MTDPGAWLAAQLADAPESLKGSVQRVTSNVPDHADARRLADDLRAAAEGLLVAPAPTPARQEALRLLTADALITLACQWVAELDPASLGDLR